MKKLLLATAATIGLTGVASAADLAVKAPVVVAPVDSWTGLYVGANIGGGLVNATIDDKGCNLACGAQSFRNGAITAGVTAGYNWQFASHGLLGIEGDVNWTDFKASQFDTEISALDAKWSSFSTIRARAGIVNDRALFYATGGVAFVDLKANGDQPGDDADCTFSGDKCLFHLSSTKTGLAAGLGAEYALGGGWTGRLEYLYVGLPRVEAREEGKDTPHDYDRYGVTSDAHLVRVGLNYLFNAGVPVAGVAPAADLADKAPVAVAPAYSWTGLYLGATIGGGLANATIDDKNAFLTAGLENLRKGAFTAGITAGYNRQFAGYGLVGIEGDFNWTNFEVSRSNSWSALDAKWRWFSTIRARAGIVNDRALFYATGGVAIVDQKANGDNTGDDSCVTYYYGRCFHVSSTETGLAAGLGAEYAFGGGWTGRLEYLYVGLPRVDAFEEGRYWSKDDSAHHGVTSDLHLVRFGLNYLFNAGAPVAGVASAADLTVKAPVAVVPVDRWTGLYVGANIGGGLVNATVGDYWANLTNGSISFNKGALTAGVAAGYNWQFASYGLLGIEGDVSWTNFKASQSDSYSALDAKWGWFSTIRARAGIVYDRALFYLTGGVAFADQTANGDEPGEDSCTTSDSGHCFHVSSTKTGLAAGLGAEYAFGGGWTGRLEYLYVGLPRAEAHEEGYESEKDFNRYGVTTDAHVVRFGLNYLFNAGAPVVARY